MSETSEILVQIRRIPTGKKDPEIFINESLELTVDADLITNAQIPASAVNHKLELEDIGNIVTDLTFFCMIVSAPVTVKMVSAGDEFPVANFFIFSGKLSSLYVDNPDVDNPVTVRYYFAGTRT